MGQGRPRHNPDKKQNNYGKWCSYHEEDSKGNQSCEAGILSPTCNGNRHNCVKEKYKLLASIAPNKRWKIK
jgi:hypothetical protein